MCSSVVSSRCVDLLFRSYTSQTSTIPYCKTETTAAAKISDNGQAATTRRKYNPAKYLSGKCAADPSTEKKATGWRWDQCCGR